MFNDLSKLGVSYDCIAILFLASTIENNFKKLVANIVSDNVVVRPCFIPHESHKLDKLFSVETKQTLT